MRLIASAIVASLLMAAVAEAAPVVFNLNFTGAAEVPGPGDPDGFGSGTLTIDTEPGIYGILSWNFTYGNLGDLTAMHIHDAPAGMGGGVFIGMGITTSGGPNTLVHTLDDNNWPGTYLKSDLQAMLDNPEDFYINIHTTQFEAGAIRAQLPEPASLALLATGGVAAMFRRRHA